MWRSNSNQQSVGRGWRGSQAGFRGNSPWLSVPSARPQPPAEPLPLGELITSITHSDLFASASAESDKIPQTISDCDYVASYSWVDSKTPTILIPGKPPTWTPLKVPQALKQDSGDFYRDPNARRYPTYPTEPAIQALFALHPDFDTSPVGIVACGSTLGNLLRFTRSVNRTFRFNVEVIGSTVFFIRKEGSPTELIPNVRGYGHTFPDAYTSWDKDVRGSDSHQRIVRYNFGGLQCLVRFEVDGYHRDKVTSAELLPLDSSSKSSNAADMPSIIKATEATRVTTNLPSPDANANLKTITAGSRIPQAAIFDLKTRSNRSEIDMSEILPRLWVAQIPNFIIAYHDRGTFHDIRTQDARKDVARWAEENQDILRKYHALITKIIDIAKTTNGKKLEICRLTELGPLEVREQAGSGNDALPPVLRARWLRGQGIEDTKPSTVADPLKEPDSRAFGPRSSSGGFSDYGDFIDEYPTTYARSEASDKDYTACSLEGCGYCGYCDY